MVRIPKTISQLIRDGALFICNHSGGKDSQAMYRLLSDIIPDDQLIVVHAHLPGVEWEGVIPHIKSTIDHEYFQVQSDKTFFDLVDNRQMWPSKQHRLCTSSLKREPINKLMRRLSRDREYTQIVHCIGLRAQESSERKKKRTVTLNKKETNSLRRVYHWLPIHKLSLNQVWESWGSSTEDWHRRIRLYKAGLIREALEGWPFHRVYAAGMTRLSCKVCILASLRDLLTSSELDPDNFNQYVRKEKEIKHCFRMPQNGKVQYLDEAVNAYAKKHSTDQLTLNI